MMGKPQVSRVRLLLRDVAFRVLLCVGVWQLLHRLDHFVVLELSVRDDVDIMDPKAWTKSPEPVFQSSPRHHVWGPGHNSFTVDERGRDMLVYHARDYEKIKGDPLFDPNRDTRVQPFGYAPDGTPVFGEPVANGPLA